VPRTKTFDRAAVLEAAGRVFASHGFEGTSTDALLRAMGIGRQSLYDTFGDKRGLYLEALEQHNLRSIADTLRALHGASTPLEGIENALVHAAMADGADGCLGVGSLCEFGRSDDEVNHRNDAGHERLQRGFAERFAEAKTLGLVEPTLELQAGARFLATVLTGLKVSARAGAPRKELRAVARLALRALHPTAPPPTARS
jgi:TetR/AcrR family transcriptional regulator, transcriptional repressor for nem operon